MKKRVVFLFVVLALVFLAQFARAVDSGVPEGIEEEAKQITDITDNAQNFIEERRWEYLGEQWRNTLMNVTAIRNVNNALEKMNPVFVFLFARDYVLGLTMFFAFLIWLFTWLSLRNYFIFFQNKNYRALAALGATIVLAHMQVFNYLSEAAFRLMFYRVEWWWSTIVFVLIMAAIAAYFILNRGFAEKFKKSQEEKEKEEQKHQVNRFKEFYEESQGE
jgi:hypothetical protein